MEWYRLGGFWSFPELKYFLTLMTQRWKHFQNGQFKWKALKNKDSTPPNNEMKLTCPD